MPIYGRFGPPLGTAIDFLFFCLKNSFKTQNIAKHIKNYDIPTLRFMINYKSRKKIIQEYFSIYKG